MFWILPFALFTFLFLIFQKKTSDWRNSLLATAIVWGFVLTAITEGLSAFRLITFGWVLGVWTFAVVVAFFIYYFLFVRKTVQSAPERIDKTPLSPLLFGTVFIVAVIGLIGLIAAPNNGDAMVYHLARVVHWIQNESVAHYPASMLRQIYLNPWSEFAILHFQILSGGDRLANLVQWFSLVGSLVGVSLIAKQLGADMRGQIFAAVVCATIPMGILQASSTQNDYAVAFWLVCFVYYLLLLKKNPNRIYALAVGASLGLAVLTKATAYIYAFPFLVWFGLSGLKMLRWRLWKPIVIIAVVAFFINLGHYTRNFELFGSPIGSSQDGDYGEFKYANEIFTPAALFSNITRNVGLHLGTPIESVNNFTEQSILLPHTLLGIDINDPRTTWLGRQFRIPKLSSSEFETTNPIHLFLILLSVILFFIYGRKHDLPGLAGYALTVTAAFLLFCFYLKWQPWHSRLHLPLFVLWSPFIALVLSRICNSRTANLIAAILLVAAFPWVFYNQNHPLIKKNNIFNTAKTDQYFSDSPELREPYIEAAKFLKSQDCTDLGLSFGFDSREYPLWVLLQEKDDKAFRIEHINVKNITAEKYKTNPFARFSPCLILSDGTEPDKEIFTEKGFYVRVFSSGSVSIFTRRQTTDLPTH